MPELTHFEMPQWDVCPFCENVAGRHPCAIVEESPTMLAFINPRQFTRGTTLVIPKRHVPTVLDLSDDEAALVMQHVRRLAQAIAQAFYPGGFNIFQNNGVLAGQSVPHYHMHIVPRYKDDTTDPFFSSVGFPKTPFEERLALAEQIKRYL